MAKKSSGNPPKNPSKPKGNKASIKPKGNGRNSLVQGDEFGANANDEGGKWNKSTLKKSALPDKDNPTKLTARNTADRAIQMLGVERKSSPQHANAQQTLIRVIRSGVPKRSFDRLLDITGITVAEIARLLHISDRTIRRYKPDQEFSPEQAERIVTLANLYSRGEEVFESIERFNTWMEREQVAFGNETPKSYLDTSMGVGLILDELGRIEHGIFA